MISGGTLNLKIVNSASVYRFRLPRQETPETKIFTYFSDNSIQSEVRMCILNDVKISGSMIIILYFLWLNKCLKMNLLLSTLVLHVRYNEFNVKTAIFWRLFKICTRILLERQMSACESIHRCFHLNFRPSSSNCVLLTLACLKFVQLRGCPKWGFFYHRLISVHFRAIVSKIWTKRFLAV